MVETASSNKQSELKAKLEALMNFLAGYNLLPKVSPEMVERAISEGYAGESFDADTGLFAASIFTCLEHDVIPYKENRIITTADWWFDCPFDYEVGYKEKLLLPGDLECALPENEEEDQAISIKCGDKVVKVKYEEVNLTKRFRCGIGINAINHFLNKIDSEFRIVEINDIGEDFAAYAVVQKDRTDQFRSELANHLKPGSVTDCQAEIEEKHKPSISS